MITKFHCNMEYELKIRLIRHKEITPEDVDKIIKLKSQHWNYSYESQYKWLYDNIIENDFHLMIENSLHELLAYLNIVYLDIECDDKIKSHLGIGNVCVEKKLKGQGYGIFLMHISNIILKQLKRPGVLICKNNLADFYSKANWFRYNGIIYINGNKFNDLCFFNYKSESKKINIPKNF